MTMYTERTTYIHEQPHEQPTDRFEAIVRPAIARFHAIARKTALFHLLFLTIGCAELMILFLFLFPLADMHVVGIGIASIFFTCLLYVILRLFFEEQKREELSALQNEYVHACKKILPFAEGAFEQHTSLAQACFRFVENLRDENFYKLPDMLSFCSSIIDSWSKQKNFSTHLMIKEMLLFSALQEHCKLVKLKPCDAQVHAALGNAYLVIADLYKDPRQKTAFWLPQKMLSSLKQKRIRAIEHAIEEFKIVKEFAPSEPWSVSQLARCYLEMQNMQQAAIAYEEVVKLSPYDEVALFSLGKLYFKMGKNADGLKMYEQLKSQNASCADDLLSSYGDICDQNYWWSVSK